jgi:protein phosphatase
LRKAFVEANASIHACGQQNREFQGMGTTTSALLLRPEGAWIAHVGDSRVYRVRAGWIEQLTYDHSLVWEYARLKKIDPADVVDIPSNVIHRCLGPEPLVQVDIAGPHAVQPGDVFLICSDGLSGQVSDHEMGAVVSTLTPAESCRFLVDLANLRSGPDNITVIVVRVGGRPESNGSIAEMAFSGQWGRATREMLGRSIWNLLIGKSRYPWPLLCLLAGTFLVADSIILSWYGRLYALLAFGAAAAIIIAGLIGLAVHYHREQYKHADAAGDGNRGTAPHVHRRSQCRIDAILVEKVARALELLAQRADERNWTADREESSQHRRRANDALRARDYPSAFREMCLAMLPYTRALEKQRQKEEVFQPLWDKPR